MCLAARIAKNDPSIYRGIQKNNRATLRVLSHIQESIEELRRGFKMTPSMSSVPGYSDRTEE